MAWINKKMPDPCVFLGGDVGFISLPYILGMFWKVFANVLLGGILAVDSINDLVRPY